MTIMPGPGLSLSILLVEDDPFDAELSRVELEQLGHHVTLALSGEEALVLFPQLQPDVVVTDVTLPGIDGYALTRELKQQEYPEWLPVLFMSGAQSEERVVAAYRAGADDFIAKPISRSILEAKLQVLCRRLNLQRQASAREKLLQRYRDQAEEEKRVAQHLMNRLVSAELLGDPDLDHWLRPAEAYSGDLVAAARTPSGVLHALLADATGHGLAAALAVMPVMQPFYRMTEQGMGIDRIAREMNQKVREFLPLGRFVAATLVAVNPAAGEIQVWNGGNPPPILIDRGRRAAAACFPAAHLPLGILADGQFDASLSVQSLRESLQIIMYSDGVVEAENAQGEAFGQERLLASFLQEEKLSSVVAALERHLGDKSAQDDLSLMALHCQPV